MHPAPHCDKFMKTTFIALSLSALLLAGCSSGGGSKAAALAKPTDLPADWVWHEIPEEKCGFAVPADWQVITTKEAEEKGPVVNGSAHDLMRGMSINALMLSLVTRDHGKVAIAADPYAGAVMITHRQANEVVDLSRDAAQTASQLASSTMKSDTAPTVSSVSLPAGAAKLVTGQLSGTTVGQPDLKLNVYHYIFAHGDHRYDVHMISAPVNGSPEPDVEQIAKTFRFIAPASP